VLTGAGPNGFTVATRDRDELFRLRDLGFGVLSDDEPTRRLACEAVWHEVDIGSARYPRLARHIRLRLRMPEVQHYVPRFLLRRFATQDQVYVFDKHHDRSFVSNVRNLAGESGFYDFEHSGNTLSLEPALQSIEDATAPIIVEICRRAEMGFLTTPERSALALFAAIQLLRVRSIRESMDAVTHQLREHLRALGADPDTVPQLQDPEGTGTRLGSIAALLDARELVPHFLDKHWLLFQAAPDEHFYIGDSPIARHNELNTNPLRGTLGVAVPGIEIYLPIDPRFTIGFMCPTIRAMYDDTYQKSLRIKVDTGVELPFHDHVGAIRDGFNLGFPVVISSEHVKRLNSLQVIEAARFVMAAKMEFGLAQRMVSEHPELRTARVPRVQ